ncbi:MAG: hypothetical protein WCX71_05810, partial [Candidatus Buchananbacteria bacterium]
MKTHEEQEGKIPKVRTIKVGFGSTSLEPAFFWALLEFLMQVRRHLGVKRGEISWKFVSSAHLIKPDPEAERKTIEFSRNRGVIFFNVLGGWDQHGSERNKSLCEICSLDLVRGEYDFIKYRPWLLSIFEAVRKNDIDGEALPCTSAENIRTLMSGLAVSQQGNP